MIIFLYQKNNISSKYLKIMKNTFVLTILFVLGIIEPNLIQAQTVYAADQTIKVSCNYKELKFDQEPVVKDGRVLVPIRKIFEALGSKVSWNDSAKTIMAETEDMKITLTVGEPKVQINSDFKGIKSSKEVVMDVPAKIIGGRTMVPVRFISESLGHQVLWDASDNTVYIDEGIPENVLESYRHVKHKIQDHEVTVYYESTEALNLSKTLGRNIEEEIYRLAAYSKDKFFIFTPVKASISAGNDDILVNVGVPNWHDELEKAMFMVFTKEQGKYVQNFAQNVVEGKHNECSYHLVDIDSDGKSEIYLDTSWIGMGNGEKDVMILKYLNGKVSKIFSEGISFNSSSSIFPYSNTLTFVRNTSNKNLYDISFNVNIIFNKDIYYRFKDQTGTIPIEKQKNYSQIYMFKLDGQTYLPDKPLIDYKNFQKV